GTPVHLLPEIAQCVAEAVGGTVGDLRAQQQQIGRCPLEEILVVSLQEEAAAAEVPPLRRVDLDDVLAVVNRRLSNEGDRIETSPGLRKLEPIGRVQRRIVAERFDEIAGADIPPAAQRRVDIEMQLLVLD